MMMAMCQLNLKFSAQVQLMAAVPTGIIVVTHWALPEKLHDSFGSGVKPQIASYVVGPIILMEWQTAAAVK